MATSQDQVPVVVNPEEVNMGEVVKLVKSLKNINLQKNSNKLGRLLISRWKYPKGKKRPALVLYMNHYVNDIERKIYIPGEIALGSFTIESGLGDSKVWSLIDPAEKVKSHGIEAQTNAGKYGLPNPGFSLCYQDYVGIVEAIDTLTMETGLNKPISRVARSRTFNSGYVIFCLEDNLPDYTQGLQWLYEQAGRTFRHRLLPLESLLVILSMAGLDSIADQNNLELATVFENLHVATNEVTNLVSDPDRSNTFNEVQEKMRKVVRNFGEKTTRIPIQAYSMIGTTQRIASKNQEKHPFAMLGAFIFEQQATRYLNHMDYLFMSSLACDYHQDKITSPPELVEWMQGRRDLERRPSYQMTKCALMNVHKQIFLSLDVLVVNYRVKAQEGKHYPKQEPRRRQAQQQQLIDTMNRKEKLQEYLESIKGRPVVVKLNNGVDYRGVLVCLDGYMNIALEQTEEYFNGQLKNKYGDTFIRGNNVLYISTQKRRGG